GEPPAPTCIVCEMPNFRRALTVKGSGWRKIDRYEGRPKKTIQPISGRPIGLPLQRNYAPAQPYMLTIPRGNWSMRIRGVKFPRTSRREDIQIAYDLICDSGFRFVRRGKFPRAKFHGYLAGEFREKHVAGPAGKATAGE